MSRRKKMRSAAHRKRRKRLGKFFYYNSASIELTIGGVRIDPFTFKRIEVVGE